MGISLRESIARVRRLPRNDTILMGRAELLCQRDRDLLEAVLIRGQSAEAIARLMGVSSRSVRRRVHRLGKRLCSRRFLSAARAMPYMARADAALVRMYFCEGVTHRRISRQLGASVYAVRRRLDRLEAQIAVFRAVQRGGLSLPPLQRDEDEPADRQDVEELEAIPA